MFCPNPFERLEIKADGGIYCCCEGWLPRQLGNILEDDLMTIWRGPAAREIRSSILDGSFRYCRACPYLPGPGGPVISTGPVRPSAERIHTLKLDYDQTCQLQCPSCRVTHSREFVDLPKVHQIHEAMIRSRVLEHTDRVYVTGAGDPFASPLYFEFLRSLPHFPTNPNLSIFLHTNGLLLDEAHFNALGSNQDRVREIGISVDAATPATYTANRQGSWEKLWRNVEFVNRLQESGRPIMLGMFYTVQANNFRELLPFTRLAFAHKVAWISVTALRNWGTYTPSDYSQRAVHLPEHPDHAEWQRVIADPSLTKDRRIVLDRFNPEFTDQDVICNPQALLPESRLRK
jgi:MoaA/NifB/PqqE/SkfB family radical SAM enzyme